MKRFLLVGIVGMAALAIAWQHVAYPTYNTTKTLYAENDLRGKKAPDLFVEQWLNTKGVETKDKIVLIDFWATWCPPCRATIPELNGYAKKFKDKLVVIGISDEAPDKVNDFMKTTVMNYNVAIDRTGKMSKVLGVQGIPHVIVITPDGIVRWQGFPLDDGDRLTEKVIQQIIDASAAK